MRKFLLSTIATGALLVGPAFAQQWDRPPDMPDGYSDYYHDQSDRFDLPARWGYRAGFDDGVKDKGQGHSYRPTEDDHYHNVPDIPNTGMNRQQVKNRFREAYVHGYERGYGAHS